MQCRISAWQPPSQLFHFRIVRSSQIRLMMKGIRVFFLKGQASQGSSVCFLSCSAYCPRYVLMLIADAAQTQNPTDTALPMHEPPMAQKPPETKKAQKTKRLTLPKEQDRDGIELTCWISCRYFGWRSELIATTPTINLIQTRGDF